jgi:hypothetical protein
MSRNSPPAEGVQGGRGGFILWDFVLHCMAKEGSGLPRARAGSQMTQYGIVKS